MLTGADIYSRIAGTPGVAAVKALIAGRLFPDTVRAVDMTYPYAMYKREGTATDQTYDGPSGLASVTLAIAVVSDEQDQAEAVGSALVAALDGDAGTWGTTAVQGCFLAEDGISGDVVTDPDTEEATAYVHEIKFDVWFETQPVNAGA